MPPAASQPVVDLPSTIADTAGQLLPSAVPYVVALVALWLILVVGLKLLGKVA